MPFVSFRGSIPDPNGPPQTGTHILHHPQHIRTDGLPTKAEEGDYENRWPFLRHAQGLHTARHKRQPNKWCVVASKQCGGLLRHTQDERRRGTLADGNRRNGMSPTQLPDQRMVTGFWAEEVLLGVPCPTSLGAICRRAQGGSRSRRARRTGGPKKKHEVTRLVVSGCPRCNGADNRGCRQKRLEFMLLFYAQCAGSSKVFNISG